MIPISILLRVNIPKIKNKKNYFFLHFLLWKVSEKIKKVFCVFKIEKTWCCFANILVFWFEIHYVPTCSEDLFFFYDNNKNVVHFLNSVCFILDPWSTLGVQTDREKTHVNSRQREGAFQEIYIHILRFTSVYRVVPI